jgi:flavodoxin
MKLIVLYSTMSGNTKKIADEIASELDCETVRIPHINEKPTIDVNNYDLIFIGTGIHFGNPNEDLIGYLKTVSLREPKVFAVFLTWGGAGKTDREVIAKLKMILETKGQRVIEDCYICYGGWNFLRRGHPNGEDAKAARKWAKKIVSDSH